MSQLLPIPHIVRAFRIKELQKVLAHLGLTKAGRKADQLARLKDYLDNLTQSSSGQRETAGAPPFAAACCHAATPSHRRML